METEDWKIDWKKNVLNVENKRATGKESVYAVSGEKFK